MVIELWYARGLAGGAREKRLVIPGHAQRDLVLGLGFKLVVAPMLIVGAYIGLLRLGGMTTQVTVFEAAMPPMVGASIVAIQYGLDARLISLLVGAGTVLSFATLPGWWLAMG